MKILFTGGGTGGHFYPIIAVAQEVNRLADERHLLQPQLFFMGPDPYDEGLLFENDITFSSTSAGKLRRYFSVLNFFDFFKTGFGLIQAMLSMFSIYPDVIFAKGGYGSFPALFAARLLKIPVFLHESDATPGRVNLWASKFAYRIAVSYPTAAEHFPKGKNIVWTGTPVRRDIRTPALEGAHEYLNLIPTLPTILILGGSQGSQKINETILSALPDLLSKYQVIHQTGKANIAEINKMIPVILEGVPNPERYKPMPYLNDLALRMSAGIAEVIISRAGSTAIFEISSWEKPSILIPLPSAADDHQRKNAFEYARAGAAIVIEEANLTPHLLASEISRLIDNKAEREKLSKGAATFKKPDAASSIANELLNVALEHEK